MKVLKPGKLHPYAVVTCEQCEAIVMVKDHECVKLLMEDSEGIEVTRYVVKCCECESQIMFTEGCFIKSSMMIPKCDLENA